MYYLISIPGGCQAVDNIVNGQILPVRFLYRKQYIL